MKEIYDWVRWFQELVRRIANEGKPFLNENARKVDWGENLAKLEYGDEGIDPFSFIYFVASKADTKQLKTVYDSVSQEFGIESPLPDPSVGDYYIFPTPPGLNVLFHNEKSFNIDLLWRLFRQAVPVDPEIEPNDFKDVLEIKNVATPKLTQSLFLINPRYFLPVDTSSADLSQTLDLPTPSEIESGGYETYRSFLDRVKRAFPGCQPYEINMLLYMQKSGSIVVSDNFYQISTNVMDDGEDYWDDFEENNRVYTGGGQYRRLTEPNTGDVVLVRRGILTGKAIGVVYKNDYREYGEWKKKLKIHVLWINKLETQLNGQTEQVGFNRAGPKTRGAFEKTPNYRSSFDLIKKLKGSSPMNSAEPKTDSPQPVEPDTKKPNLLNQILYGPPGTGKTWNTVDYALAIIEDESLDIISDNSREDNLQRFNELKEKGQIQMVTFHQSYNYEDFIEGIRPVLDDDGSGSVKYELVPGVFRRIVKQADENTRQPEQVSGESWDIDELLQAFAEWVDENLKSEEQIDLNVVDRKSGNKRIIEVIWSGDETFESIKAGIQDNPRNLTKDIIKRDYRAFYEGEIKSIEDIKSTGTSNKHWAARYYLGLYHKIKEFHDEEWQLDEHGDIEPQNYVLIIDEINRGNIAKIFGELITLIEPSKRIGADDAATVTLPYSKEEFGVPDNLYIIGTMNTADRSIALLDTALRRRFNFVEMMPDPTLVPDEIEGVNCQELLKIMNEHIRFLLDREHQIGHTYFLKIDDLKTLEDTFKNKIIPLLQEYFYDNWEKIDLVLNRNGFIRKITIESGLFKESDLIDDQSEIYELLPADDDKWHDPGSYRAIYEQAESGSEQGS